jgi:hypothetical protein
MNRETLLFNFMNECCSQPTMKVNTAMKNIVVHMTTIITSKNADGKAYTVCYEIGTTDDRDGVISSKMRVNCIKNSYPK